MEKVSVIIQNWNGEQYLDECLASIFRQSYKNIETIVVDSASKDNSVRFIRKKFPRVKVIALKKDKGAPYANNLGCMKSSGKYVMFLNNDTKLQKNTIKKLVDKIKNEKTDIVVSPVQLDMEGKAITGAGCPHYWIGGDLYKLFRMKGQSPFYLAIACCMLSKDIFNKNKFNENLFFYEEVEWSWRLLLKNVKLDVIKDSFFHHKMGGTSSSPKVAFNMGKSITATHFLCFKLHSFLFFLPLIFYNYLRVAIVDTYRNRSPLFIQQLFYGIGSVIKNLSLFVKDRRDIQKKRYIGDTEIIKKMIKSVDYTKKMLK